MDSNQLSWTRSHASGHCAITVTPIGIELVVVGSPSKHRWSWIAYWGGEKLGGGRASSLREAIRAAETAGTHLDEHLDNIRKFAESVQVL